MSFLFIPLGLIILAVSFTDLVMTTLTLHGGGPFSSRMAANLWRAALAINRRRPSHRFLSIMGVTITLSVIGFWVLLFWIGWSVVFFGDQFAVVDADSRLPADFWSRFYYAGFTVVTLGIGDYVPNGGLWEIMTAVAAASGYTVLGLSISYVVPTISAVVHKRQLAAYISSIGRTSEEIVSNTWDGESFASLEAHVSSISPMVSRVGEHYLAYPVLHYYHSRSAASSAPLSLAALDDALTILEYGLEPEYRMAQGYFIPLQGALTSLLSSLSAAYIRAGDEPPLPDLEQLRERGVPVLPTDEFRAATSHLAGRRRLLMAFVNNDGFDWGVLARPLDDLATRRLAADVTPRSQND